MEHGVLHCGFEVLADFGVDFFASLAPIIQFLDGLIDPVKDSLLLAVRFQKTLQGRYVIVLVFIQFNLDVNKLVLTVCSFNHRLENIDIFRLKFGRSQSTYNQSLINLLSVNLDLEFTRLLLNHFC